MIQRACACETLPEVYSGVQVNFWQCFMSKHSLDHFNRAHRRSNQPGQLPVVYPGACLNLTNTAFKSIHTYTVSTRENLIPTVQPVGCRASLLQELLAATHKCTPLAAISLSE